MEKLLFLVCLVHATASSFLTDSLKVKKRNHYGRPKTEAYRVDLKHTSPNNHFEVSIVGTECTTTLIFENAADYSTNNIKEIVKHNAVLREKTACPDIPKGEHHNPDVKAKIIEHNLKSLIVYCKETKEDGILLAVIKLSGPRILNYYSNHPRGTVADYAASYCSQVLPLRKSIKEGAVFEETSLRDFNSHAESNVPIIN